MSLLYTYRKRRVHVHSHAGTKLSPWPPRQRTTWRAISATPYTLATLNARVPLRALMSNHFSAAGNFFVSEPQLALRTSHGDGGDGGGGGA